MLPLNVPINLRRAGIVLNYIIVLNGNNAENKNLCQGRNATSSHARLWAHWLYPASQLPTTTTSNARSSPLFVTLLGCNRRVFSRQLPAPCSSRVHAPFRRGVLPSLYVRAGPWIYLYPSAATPSLSFFLFSCASSLSL